MLFRSYNGALEAANKCITIKPDLPEVYNIRAAVYFSINNLPAAEKDLDKALSLKKDFSDAYKNRGILYMNTNRKAQACSDFQNAKLYGDQTVDALINTTCR